jgi:ATP-dependent Clp protease ATP-binding subunit ClpB
MIVFKQLDRDALQNIVDIEFNEVGKRAAEKRISLICADTAQESLVQKGSDRKFGAHPRKRAIEKNVEDPLIDKSLSGDISRGMVIDISHEKDRDRLSLIPKQ